MEESQGSISWVMVIFIGVIIVYVVAKKLFEGYAQEKLRQQVNWCVNGGQGDRDWPLLHYINSLAMLSDTPKYKVTGDSESTDANTLIDAYKNDLQNTYMTKRFSSTFVKLAIKIRELDFFILTLNSFLHEKFEDIHHKNRLYRAY